jgi:hypothetical protein
MTIPQKRFLALVAALAFSGMVGCSPSTVVVVGEPVTPTQENLRKIGIAYIRYTTEKKQPPKGLSDLKPLLCESGDPDKLLRSDRDNQPLVICWDIDTRVSPAWAKSPPVLGYEKQGVNGSRYVLTLAMGPTVKLMSEDEFRKASFPPGHTPEL